MRIKSARAGSRCAVCRLSQGRFLYVCVDCLRDLCHSLHYDLALVVAQRVAEGLQEAVRVPAQRCGAVGLPSLGRAEAARIEP